MRANEFSRQQLDEIAMNPSSLRQLSAKIDATVGIEFEMIVPSIVLDVSEDEQREDFSVNEKVRDFKQIRNFFSESENNDITAVDTFIESLKDDYTSWVGTEQDRSWQYDGRAFFDNYASRDFDEDAIEYATAEVERENPDMDHGEELEDLIMERLESLRQDWLDNVWNNEGRLYDRARAQWEANEWTAPSVRDYFNHIGIDLMSDLPYEMFLVWPHWITSEESLIYGQTLAREFSDMIGMDAEFHPVYHMKPKSTDAYTLEPDTSIQPDSDDDTGMEFVSPPLPLDIMMAHFKQVIKWAKRKNCYTNESTGLHMNVSVPFFTRDSLDYVKLVVLLGDHHVLEKFKRMGNVQCRSVLTKLSDVIKLNPSAVEQMLFQMRQGLSHVASRLIHDNYTNKKVSINIKDNRIEFRSPGNDWLNDDWSTLESTLLRFVVALDAACDPKKYRQEYLKKLHAILTPDSKTDPLSVFVKYAAHEITKADLKMLMANIQSDRERYNQGWKRWTIKNKQGMYMGVVGGVDAAAAKKAAASYLSKLSPEADLSTLEFTVEPIKS